MHQLINYFDSLKFLIVLIVTDLKFKIKIRTSISLCIVIRKIQKMKFQEFGSLLSFKQMQSYFQKCRLESRHTLFKRLHQNNNVVKKQQTLSIINSSNVCFTSNKKSNINTSREPNNLSNFENDISQTFQGLIQWAQFDANNQIVKQVGRIFNLNFDYLSGITKQEKRMYILEKIHEQVSKYFSQGYLGLNTSTTTGNEQEKQKLQNSYQKHQAFQWLGVDTEYKSLKPIFQQILMERVKLFDNQLSQLTSLTKNNSSSVQQLVTTARTADFPTCNQNKNQKDYHSLTNINKKRQLKKQLQDPIKGFCDIKIRDESTFSLDKWTRKQQKEFQTKRSQYKARQSKIQNNPILFQFVKKYTKTIKARQNIYKKWESRQKSQITPQQLKYLCATSLFLNQTLTSSQKNRYKKNIKTAGKRLLSKLQFNIAQHIIQTYKIFMKKVFDLRAAYYQQLTLQRKQQYSATKKKQQRNSKKNQRIQRLRKSIKMFTIITNSEKMKLLMNPKILRWVVLFCQKLKKRAQIQNKNLKKSKSLAFVKKLQSKKIQPFLLALKKAAPAAKILKRQNHESYRSQTKKYVENRKFFYEPKFEQTINKFNKLRTLKTQSSSSSYSYRKQLSGGPKQQNKKVYVNLSKKTVQLESKKCLQDIIKIQSIWRKYYYRKIYAKLRDQKRKLAELDFETKYDRLWRIYPTGKKINFKAIQNRLQRFSMRIENIAKPYIRTYRNSINNYTSFSKHNFSLPELKLKYSKMSNRRLSQFTGLVEQNSYSTIIQNSYVITQKQINAPLCIQGANILWWAVVNSNLELVRKLLEGGGNPNSKNMQMNSCLHEAMRKGDIEIIFILLDYGADLNIKNNKKQTPLYFCTKKMLKLLGLEDGTISNLAQTNAGFTDNNKLFYKPQLQQIYPYHYY